MSPGAAFEALELHAALAPDRLALVDAHDGLRLSYGAWDERVARAAAMLHGLEVERGQIVAILADNSIDFLDAVFACARLGAVAQTLSTRLTFHELEPLVRQARPRLLLHGEAQTSIAHQLEGAGCAPAVPLAGLAAAAAKPWRRPRGAPAVNGSDAWMIVYTGGSTGVPKGAVLTHAGVRANAEHTVAAWGLGERDVAILDAPLYHTGGLNVLTTPLVHAGGVSIVCRRFDPELVFDLLATGEPTLLFGVPTMLLRLAQHARWADADLSRLRRVITGGAPAPGALFEAFAGKRQTLRLGYGLSEAGPNNFWLSDEAAVRKPGSVGWPLPHVRARLVDGEGRELRREKDVGELCLAGPHVMAGYFGDAAATAAAIDADGWLHTGDLAARDPEGAYAIVGRKKDMYISGGENVYPAEIEDALHAHPAVAEAAVIGVPHATWGETGVAAVAPRDGLRLDEGELRTFLRARLAGFKVPSAFVFLDALPRTGAGKLDRPALRRIVGAVLGPAGASAAQNEPETTKPRPPPPGEAAGATLSPEASRP